MKVILAGLIAAASMVAVSAPVSAAPARTEVQPVTASFQTVALHRHHRHKVCVMRHHHRVCSWR